VENLYDIASKPFSFCTMLTNMQMVCDIEI